jgi:hypothetical protein
MIMDASSFGEGIGMANHHDDTPRIDHYQSL